MKNRWKFLDSDTIKIIAIVTMLIDHIGASLIETMLFSGSADVSYSLYEIDTVLRAIGRIAFPIFAFLLTEGFYYTHSRKKYLGRLTLFAILSEIPFDLAFYGELFYRNNQNVFWTLVIGFCVIWSMECLRELYGNGFRILRRNEHRQDGQRSGSVGGHVIAVGIASAILVFAGVMLSEILHVDYGGYGVLLILLFYMGRRLKASPLITCIAGYLLFLWEPYCIGGFLLLLFYNGKKRQRGKGFQFFFYLFYPVHLLILGLIRVVFFAN